jgi:probable O-glycosylation ligase (exosortase A-associated)
MELRDIALTVIIIGSVPMILKRPYVGVLVWSWLSYMNPHRLVWGFAYGQPFAQLVAITTIGSLFFSDEEKKLPWSATLKLWVFLVFWTCVTSFFAIDFDRSQYEFELFLKIQFMTFLTLLLVNSKERLIQLIWVIVASLGFFGLKGGVFTILTGGQYQVLGPRKSFIEGNNELAFALVMTLPLMFFLWLNSENKWIRWGLLGGLGLFAFAIVGSQSRGAFLAAGAIAVFLFLRSRRKFLLGVGLILAVVTLLAFMPASWHDRMGTITNYEEDGSAMGRINAWGFAFNLALDRPLTGGGFDTFTQPLFFKYAPDPTDFHDSHSIYFEMLGEHGFVGLFLFLMLGLAVYRQGGRVVKACRDRPELTWAGDLVRMAQVSIVGYFVGGAFLGRAYFDLYYHVLAMVLITQQIVRTEIEAAGATEAPRRSRFPAQVHPPPGTPARSSE